RTLGAVLGTALLTVFDAGGIQRAAHGVVANTRKVFYTTATDQHYAVLLQVMTFTTNVGGDFKTDGQANTAYLTQCRVRFLWRGGVHTGAHATALRAVLQRRDVAFLDDPLARLTYQLVDSCHLLAPLLSFDTNEKWQSKSPAKLGVQESKEVLVHRQGRPRLAPGSFFLLPLDFSASVNASQTSYLPTRNGLYAPRSHVRAHI